MMSINLKVLLFTLNNFDPRADSAFAQCTSVVEGGKKGRLFPHFKNTFLEKLDTGDRYKDPDPAASKYLQIQTSFRLERP